MTISVVLIRKMSPQSALWQSGNLGVLREVSFGFSEDVGTLGFLYTPFDVFGFFVVVFQV